MPVIELNRASLTGWVGATSRSDLPSDNRFETISNGATTNLSVRPLRARLALDARVALDKPVDPDMPPLRKPRYRYVEAGFAMVSTYSVLWSDSASICTIVSLWRPGHAGLAHIVPSPQSTADTLKLMKMFPGLPTEIHLATMHRDAEYGFETVRAEIARHYGAKYAAMKVFLITGYNGHEWEQRHQLGVDPKTGAYPVFNA